MKKLIFFLSLIVCMETVTAQDELLRPIDSLSFANFETNALWYDPQTSLLVPFFIRFNAVIESNCENINILHIGGSHVQAGTFPNRIRTNILSVYPDMVAGRGMIFPYSAAKRCNNPQDYAVLASHEFDLCRNVERMPQKTLGVTGIAISTDDTTAEILIHLTDRAINFSIDKIILLGYADSGCVVPAIKVDSNILQPDEIDSVLRRYTFNITVCDSFRIVLPCDSHSRFTLTGVFLDNTRPGITYHSIGVNGATVPAFLKCPYFEQDLQLLKPDLVIFGLGINDASGKDFDTVNFKNNYLQLIHIIQQVNPECAFIFITNNDSYKRVSRNKYAVNRYGLNARDVFYRLATITGGAVWDQFEIMGGLKSMENWRLAKLAQRDRIHFTSKGYTLIGDLFFNAFMQTKNEIVSNLFDKEAENKEITGKK
jgi:lysophospholipase L1-like esterase